MAKMMDMATAPFNELVKMSSDFVAQGGGEWDHSAWLAFVSNAQKKGYKFSEETLSSLGEVLEAMKRFYSATASVQGVEKAMFNVAKDSAEFIQEHKGIWGHSEWEAFTRNVEKNRLSLSEETTSYLGSILESTKVLYSLSPLTVTTAKVAKRSTAVPKKEPTSEVKAKAIPAGKTSRTKKDKTASTASAPQKQKPVTKPSTANDDLTAITGVGPALQKKLNTQGINTYAQIAALSDKEIEQLEQTIIKFPGRIKRDDWIGQAKRLGKS